MEFQVSQGQWVQKHPGLANIKMDLQLEECGDRGGLVLQVRFNEDECDNFFGSLRYHLRRATVQIRFDGCSAGDVNTTLDSEIKLTSFQEHEFEYTGSSTTQQGREEGATLEAAAAGKLTASSKDTQSLTTTGGERHKLGIKDSFANVVVGGGEDYLHFSFDAPLPNAPLRGRVAPEDWCKVLLGPGAGRITAMLKVSEKDILISGVGGIWPATLSPDKAFLIRQYALRYIDWKKYLSLVELNIIPLIREICESQALIVIDAGDQGAAGELAVITDQREIRGEGNE